MVNVEAHLAYDADWDAFQQLFMDAFALKQSNSWLMGRRFSKG